MRFEYGSDPGLAGAMLSAPAEIGAGTDPLLVEVSASGLQALTTYYYRVVATSGDGSTAQQA